MARVTEGLERERLAMLDYMTAAGVPDPGSIVQYSIEPGQEPGTFTVQRFMGDGVPRRPEQYKVPLRADDGHVCRGPVLVPSRRAQCTICGHVFDVDET